MNAPQGYRAQTLFDLILGDISPESLCKKKPTGVRCNASFIIDLESVALKDLPADDNNGAWISSYPRRSYVVELCEGHVISVEETDCKGDNVFTLCRQYSTHKGTSEFRRIIATVIDAAGTTHPRAILQYFFKGGVPIDVTIPCHGNSRSGKPYFRTQPSTIKSIQSKCYEKCVPQLYDDFFEGSGGIQGSCSLSEEPRNKMQIYNARKNLHTDSSKDEIFDLLQLLKEHQNEPDGGFLREVVLSSTPCAVLATQEQLDHLVYCCCNLTQSVPMCIDATFNLGNFYVTIITYKNLVLKHSMKLSHPVFIGPVFLHMERGRKEYGTFFSVLLKLEPRLTAY